MISEKIFAGEFSGFWAECLPFLTPQAITELNLSGTTLADGRREWKTPLVDVGDSSNNDVIAETAFELFAESLEQRKAVLVLCKNRTLLHSILERAKQRVLGLRRNKDTRPHRASWNTKEAVQLARRLEIYFGDCSPESIVIQPRFRGCGILDSCFGDIFARSTLYELKMVDRNLRSADIRQVLAYCALNHQSSQYQIDSVTILNPRKGMEFVFDVEDLSERAAGKTSAELFHQITAFLSDFETLVRPS